MKKKCLELFCFFLTGLMPDVILRSIQVHTTASTIFTRILADQRGPTKWGAERFLAKTASAAWTIVNKHSQVMQKKHAKLIKRGGAKGVQEGCKRGARRVHKGCDLKTSKKHAKSSKKKGGSLDSRQQALPDHVKKPSKKSTG